jgi:hypothetical protein
MKKSLIACLALIGMIFSSCEDFFYKTIDIESEDFPPGIALSAIWKFPTNDDNPLIVSEALAVLDRAPNLIPKSTLTIYKNDALAQEIEISDGLGSVKSFSADPGERVRITLEVPGYQKLEAEQTVPDSTRILDVKFTRDTTVKLFGLEDIDLFEVRIQDDPGRPNYYRAQARYIFDRGAAGLDTSHFIALTPEFANRENQSDLISDEIFNGREFVLTFYDFGTFSTDPKYVLLELIQVTRDYYLNRESQALSEIANGNPFAEPVILHQNVRQGQGIFALSYATEWLILR